MAAAREAGLSAGHVVVHIVIAVPAAALQLHAHFRCAASVAKRAFRAAVQPTPAVNGTDLALPHACMSTDVHARHGRVLHAVTEALT